MRAEVSSPDAGSLPCRCWFLGWRRVSGPVPCGSSRRAEPQNTGGSAAATIDYQQRVHTILAAKCLSCHSAERRSGGLSLASYADALDGGRSGAAIRPGNAAESLLVRRLIGDVAPSMPLKLPALSAGEIATIRTWIDEGARETIAAPAARAKWEAPLALERPAVPDVVWRDWTTPVDRFVAAYLTAHGGGGAGADWRRGIRQAGLPRHLGSAAAAGRSAGVSRRTKPEQARSAGPASPCRSGQVRRTLDLVLERPAAQR